MIDYEMFMAETGLDRDTIMELYQVFLEEILLEKERLLSLYSGKDFEKLGKAVHNVKGISGSYKAQQVFEQAALMDSDIKRGRYDGIGGSLIKLVDAIDSAASDIRSYF